MKIKDILQYNNDMDALLNKKLPIKVSFCIIKNKNNFKEILKNFDEERKLLIKRYGKRDKEQNLIIDEEGKVEIEDINSFTKEINELLQIEEDFLIYSFSIKELDNYEIEKYDILTPKELSLLSFMITDEEDEEQII